MSSLETKDSTDRNKFIALEQSTTITKIICKCKKFWTL